MDLHDLAVIAEKILAKLAIYLVLGALVGLAMLLWYLVRRFLFPPGFIVPLKPPVVPGENPQVEAQLAQIDACRQAALDLRQRYEAQAAARWDMAGDVRLRALDGMLEHIHRTYDTLMKTQRPLSPDALQAVLAYRQQLDALANALG